MCRTRAYLMAEKTRYHNLPPDSSIDCPRQEKALTTTLHRLINRLSSSNAALLYEYISARRPGRAGSLLLRVGHRLLSLGLRPDYAAVLAANTKVIGIIVEAACTSPDHILKRAVPRILLYKTWLDSCVGGFTLPLYAPLVPGEPPVLLRIDDPIDAWSCVARRAAKVVEVVGAEAPPPPGTRSPPCSHCGYRTICPYSRLE